MASSSILHVHDHFNAEEAAHAAGEFVMSLDNLPGEVNFLLEEIREKDVRIMELLARINRRHQALTKHKIDSSKNPTPQTPTFQLPLPPGSSIPTNHLSPKDAQAIMKLQGEFTKVEALQEEKIKLAERLERIVGRARERGRAEWKRVGGIDVDELEGVLGGPLGGIGGGGLGEMGSGELLLPSGGLGSGSDRTKKKKPQALPLPPSFSAPIVHPPSTSMLPPPLPPSRHSSSQNMSSSRGRKAQRVVHSPTQSSEADAEGEYDDQYNNNGEDDKMDVEGMEVAEGEDDQIYCFCGKNVYGEMIGCDNDDCEIEWFHISCVGVEEPVPEKWYCPFCIKKGYKQNKKRKK